MKMTDVVTAEQKIYVEDHWVVHVKDEVRHGTAWMGDTAVHESQLTNQASMIG